MHPLFLGEAARHHVHSLIEEADSARLARAAAGAPPPGLRRRLGLGLIAVGSKLAAGDGPPLAGLPGG
ncbi:MAG: hypothetical protein M3273_04170, partial [Actinomycetota bacterium]|nr:hypothetical protein [Actinomycetota bacterium]